MQCDWHAGRKGTPLSKSDNVGRRRDRSAFSASFFALPPRSSSVPPLRRTNHSPFLRTVTRARIDRRPVIWKTAAGRPRRLAFFPRRTVAFNGRPGARRFWVEPGGQPVRRTDGRPARPAGQRAQLSPGQFRTLWRSTMITFTSPSCGMAQYKSGEKVKR